MVALLGLVRYGGTVGNGLVSDDYVWIGVVRSGLASVFAYHGGYHYNPVALAFLSLEHRLSGASALGYHVGSVVLFLATALMVGRTGLVLGLGRRVSWSAAVLFVTSSLPFEGPLWATGTFYSLSALLYLLGLEIFVADTRTRRGGLGVLFNVVLVLALLTHEQAVSLVVACAVWTLLRVDQPPMGDEIRERWRGRLTGLVVPGLLVVAFVALKLVLAQGEPQAPGLSLGRRLTSPLAVNLVRVVIPNVPGDYAATLVRPEVGEWARGVWRVALVTAGAALFVFAGRRAKFLMAWAVLLVGTMVVGIGGMTSRHFVLALVPGSLLAALAFTRLAESSARALAARRPRRAQVVSFAVFVALIAGCAVTGIVMLEDRIRVWTAASRIADQILDDVSGQQAARRHAVRLYALDLPDGLPLPGENEPAYVFRLGFESAVEQRYPGRFELVATVRSAPLDPHDRRVGTPLSVLELQRLTADPLNLVLRYERSSRRLRALP